MYIPEEELDYYWSQGIDPQSVDYYAPQNEPHNPAEDVDWTPGLVADLAASEYEGLPTRNTNAPTTTGGTLKTPAEIEAEGRAYDQAHGLVGGYMSNGVWVHGSPSGGPGSYSGGSIGTYTPPQYVAGGGYAFPRLSLPTYGGWPELQRPDPFEFEDFDPGEEFHRPDPKAILDDPSYQWRFDEGMRPVTNNFAARGLGNTGTKMKALVRYGQGFASNEYDRIYDRAAGEYDRNLATRFNTWNANRTNKLDAYKTNWGVTTDVDDRGYQRSIDAYDRAVSNARAEFEPQARWAELQFNRDWDYFKFQNDDAYRRWAKEGDWASDMSHFDDNP